MPLTQSRGIGLFSIVAHLSTSITKAKFFLFCEVERARKESPEPVSAIFAIIDSVR